MRNLRILVLYDLILYTVLLTNHDFRCPESSERRLREKIFCKTDANLSYVCLFDDNNKYNTELCTKEPDFMEPGIKVVLKSKFDGKPCENSRFQPFKFWTTSGNDCVFLKSKCEEEGQILDSVGTKTSDTLCRCDYRKGYAFIALPVNHCSCDPSFEDCSCYRKACNENHILSPDYNCTHTESIQHKILCSSNIQPGSEPGKPIRPNVRNVYEEQQKDIQRVPQLPWNILCLTTITVAVSFAVVLICKTGYSFNEVSKELVQKVLRKTAVIVIGPPKSGKYTLVKHAALTLFNEYGYDTCHCKTINEVEQELQATSKKKTIILNSLFNSDREMTEIDVKWMTLCEKVNNNTNVGAKLIIPCLQTHFELRPNNINFLSESVFDITSLLVVQKQDPNSKEGSVTE